MSVASTKVQGWCRTLVPMTSPVVSRFGADSPILFVGEAVSVAGTIVQGGSVIWCRWLRHLYCSLLSVF